MKSGVAIALIWAGSLLASLGLASCGWPEPQSSEPGKERQAQISDASDAAAISRRAQENAAAERERLARDRLQADIATARGAYDVAVAKAQSGHKTAVELCARRPEVERRECKEAADAQLKQELAGAERLRPPY